MSRKFAPMNVVIWLLLRALLHLLRNRGGTGFCANRTEKLFRLGRTEVQMTFRDTEKPDGYSREELVKMLDTVRLHERVGDWKCPEPDETTLQQRATEGRVVLPPRVVGYNAEDGVNPGAPIYRRSPIPQGCEQCAGCPDCLTNDPKKA